MTRRHFVWWLLGATCLTAGCGGGLVPVRGRVLLDDIPVAGATVTLIPIEEGRPASGLTDAQGGFRLTTFKRDDGALPGRYKIVVTKTDALPPPPEGEYGDADRIIKHGLAVNPPRDKQKPALPAVYADAARTPLRCTLPADSVLMVPLDSKGK
jgi:hypothetical protein